MTGSTKVIFTERGPMKSAFILKLCAHIRLRLELAFSGIEDLSVSDKFAIDMLSSMDFAGYEGPAKDMIEWIKSETSKLDKELS